MFTSRHLSKSVRFALIGGASLTAFTSPTAIAFEEENKDVERIEVTGSRIKRTDFEGANPVTTIEAAQIEKMSVNNVGDLLQNLTSSAGGSG